MILGEIFEDSHHEFKHKSLILTLTIKPNFKDKAFLKNLSLFSDYHEPGTLPKPPLHNEAHDEL